LHGKRTWTVVLVLLLIYAIWWIISAPYCYFIAHSESLKEGATAVKFWRIATGHIPKLRFSIVEEGADFMGRPQKLLVGDRIKEDLLGQESADVSIPIKADQKIVSLEFQCTAGDDGWKQTVILRRHKDGTLAQDRPIIVRPNFPSSVHLYPEKRFDLRSLWLYVPAAIGVAALVYWAWLGTNAQ
jgi:hypothetical protein